MMVSILEHFFRVLTYAIAHCPDELRDDCLYM